VGGSGPRPGDTEIATEANAETTATGAASGSARRTKTERAVDTGVPHLWGGVLAEIERRHALLGPVPG